MRRWWCRAAVDYIKKVTGTENDKKYRNAYKRGNKPQFVERNIITKPDPTNRTATSHQQRRLIDFHKKARALAKQAEKKEKTEEEGHPITEEAQKKYEQLWQKMCKTRGANLSYKDESAGLSGTQ